MVKKSTVVNIQSNFKIFGQHQHFEVIFIILSRVDHDYPRKALKSSKIKNCQIRVSLGEVNWTLTMHNFHILHHKIITQSSFRWKFNSLQLCVSKLKPENASFLPSDMAQKISQNQLIDSWISVNWWKVNCTLKSQTLTFFIKIKFQRSQFINTCQNVRLVH